VILPKRPAIVEHFIKGICDSRTWVFSLLVLLALIVTGEILTHFVEPHIRYNKTASMPLGFYWDGPVGINLARGDLVFFCPSPEIISRGLAVGIHSVNGEECPTHTASFLKRIIAIPGDLVDTRKGDIRVNGKVIPRSTPISGPRGRLLQSILPQTYKVAPNQAWGISEDPFGYDSRYYGSFQPIGRAYPLITWKAHSL